MSRLKISENLFLEKNELNRLIKSVVDDGYKRLLSPMVTNFGIVRDSQNNSFKIVKNGTKLSYASLLLPTRYSQFALQVVKIYSNFMLHLL